MQPQKGRTRGVGYPFQQRRSRMVIRHSIRMRIPKGIVQRSSTSYRLRGKSPSTSTTNPTQTKITTQCRSSTRTRHSQKTVPTTPAPRSHPRTKTNVLHIYQMLARSRNMAGPRREHKRNHKRAGHAPASRKPRPPCHQTRTNWGNKRAR